MKHTLTLLAALLLAPLAGWAQDESAGPAKAPNEIIAATPSRPNPLKIQFSISSSWLPISRSPGAGRYLERDGLLWPA